MKRRYWITGIIIIVGIYLITHHFYIKKQKSTTAIPVSIATVSKKDVTVKLDAIGQVTPVSTVNITSQVDGQLMHVNFKEGEIVQKNQILFQIDPRPYQAKLNQAEAQLQHDRAQLKAAELLLQRSTPLVKKGFLDKQDFDQTKANADSALATVKADEANVEQAKLNLDYCTITSPVTGRTGNLLVNAGNIITAASKTTLVTINQIEPIYISFSVPEKELIYLKNNLPLTVNKETGKIVFINNTIDSTTGTIQLKALFDNKNQTFWPGQFVSLKMPLKNLSQVLVIPTEAVQEGQQGSYVYVVSNDTANYRLIKTGDETSEGTIVENGLNAGEQVITKGQLRLVDGSKVTIE